MIILSVDYIEFFPKTTYAGVVLHYKGKEIYRSRSHNINADFDNAIAMAEEWCLPIFTSASFENFISDCEKAGMIKSF